MSTDKEKKERLSLEDQRAPEGVSLNDMSRHELNVELKIEGVKDPEALPNREACINALIAAGSKREVKGSKQKSTGSKPKSAAPKDPTLFADRSIENATLAVAKEQRKARDQKKRVRGSGSPSGDQLDKKIAIRQKGVQAIGKILEMVGSERFITNKEVEKACKMSEKQSRTLLNKMVKAHLLNRTKEVNEKGGVIYHYYSGNHIIFR